MAADTPTTRAGFLYIARYPRDPSAVKIGKSDNPWRRIKELDATALAEPLVLVDSFSTPDMDSAERRAHRRLARHRIRSNREWFGCSVEEAVRCAREVVEEIGRPAAGVWPSSDPIVLFGRPDRQQGREAPYKWSVALFATLASVMDGPYLHRFLLAEVHLRPILAAGRLGGVQRINTGMPVAAMYGHPGWLVCAARPLPSDKHKLRRDLVRLDARFGLAPDVDQAIRNSAGYSLDLQEALLDRISEDHRNAVWSAARLAVVDYLRQFP